MGAIEAVARQTRQAQNLQLEKDEEDEESFFTLWIHSNVLEGSHIEARREVG